MKNNLSIQFNRKTLITNIFVFVVVSIIFIWLIPAFYLNSKYFLNSHLPKTWFAYIMMFVNISSAFYMCYKIIIINKILFLFSPTKIKILALLIGINTLIFSIILLFYYFKNFNPLNKINVLTQKPKITKRILIVKIEILVIIGMVLGVMLNYIISIIITGNISIAAFSYLFLFLMILLLFIIWMYTHIINIKLLLNIYNNKYLKILYYLPIINILSTIIIIIIWWKKNLIEEK